MKEKKAKMLSAKSASNVNRLMLRNILFDNNKSI